MILEGKFCKYMMAGFLLGVALFGPGDKPGAETFTVTSNANSGAGSLREAIAASNTTTGVQTIDVRISAAISLSATLSITAPVVIEGNGTTVTITSSISVFTLEAGSDGCWIKNLALTNSTSISSSDIGITVNSNANTISGCVIGTNWNGSPGLGFQRGIYIFQGSNNLVGGDRNLGQGNVISGNAEYGVAIVWQSGNRVCGNIIGLNPGETAALANANSGVCIINSTNNYVGLPQDGWGNVVSGNYVGILLDTGGNNNIVQNNIVGLNSSGQRFGNTAQGVDLYSGTGNLVGGATGTLQKNIISGNSGTSEMIVLMSNNTVTGNYIGTTLDGLSIMPGAGYKIWVRYAVKGLLGTKGTSQGNLLAGGNYGIYVENSANQIGFYGNTICGFATSGIYLASGTNNSKTAPTINFADQSTVSGTSVANDFIQVFQAEPAGSRGGSLHWVGCATADGSGNWSVTSAGLAVGDYVCALASDGNNNTSIFSLNRAVIATTPTESPTITATPTCTPTSSTSPTATTTSTETLTCTESPTPTISNTITLTSTPTGTGTATLTLTSTGTQTPVQSNTPSPTITETKTITTTLTITATQTPFQSSTPSPSSTLTATITPTPTMMLSATFTGTATVSPTMAETATLTASPAANGESTIRAFPNPASGHLRFLLDLKQSAAVSITIYNFAGEPVAEIIGNQPSGTSRLEWQCAAFAPGIYLARIKVDGEELKKIKFAIQEKE